MARRHLSAREVLVPSSSAISATGPGDGRVAELLPFPQPDLPTHHSEFQRLVTNVVELAQILTRATGSAIAFRGERGTICRARSGEGAPPLGALVDTTSGISRQCLDSGTSLRCDDITTDGRVDPDVSQAVGIRALAVVPIFSNSNSNSKDDICGILEVFSHAPGVFTDQHLKTLRQLADWVGSAASMPGEAPICVSTSPARLAGSSIQMHDWTDVLIDSHLPWKRFIASVCLHVVVIGTLSGLSIIWPQELIVSPPSLRAAHVVYYPTQSFPARESSPPAVRPMPQHTSANPEVIKAGRNREPLVASGTHSPTDAQKAPAVPPPPPAMPMSAISRSRKLELGTAVLPPPPHFGRTEARQSHLPNFSVVAPPPDLIRGSGLRKMNAPRAAVVPPSPDVNGAISMKTAGLDGARLGTGSARGADISVVPPPPSLNDRATLAYGARGANSNTGVHVVGPPSSLPDRAQLDAGTKPSAISSGVGASQVVPPPPSLEGAGAGNSVEGGRGPANSLADGGSQVVPPAPSMQNGGNDVGGGRTSSLDHADSQVVPPAPSVQFRAGDNSGAAGRGRDSSLAGARAEAVLPPALAQGEGNSTQGGKPGGARAGNDVSITSVPETGGDRKHPIFQDVELRVVSLTWAPSRSSYFSNFEVFIAEKWLNKKESEFIKLVYEFLPYQRRLSEYDFHDLKVRRLRVTRDSTCDESLMQMAWPEGENGPPGSHHSGDALASTSADRNNALPCYRTTADDYRRAVSRSR